MVLHWERGFLRAEFGERAVGERRRFARLHSRHLQDNPRHRRLGQHPNDRYAAALLSIDVKIAARVEIGKTLVGGGGEKENPPRHIVIL